MTYIKLTTEELKIKLQVGTICIAKLTKNLLDKIKIGSSDSECKLLELQILQSLLKYIRCYDLSKDDNCISECELVEILDYISSVCQMCYPRIEPVNSGPITLPGDI
jgi:hypothetical protein